MFIIQQEDWDRFFKIREKLFKQISKALEEDGYCKTDEGDFTVYFTFPNYWQNLNDNDNGLWCFITLYSYLIIPHDTYYSWSGKTFKEALDKCEKDVNKWIELKERYLNGEEVEEYYINYETQ